MEGKHITERVMGWMEVLHGVCNGVLDNVDGLTAISVDCRVGAQAQKYACNNTYQERDGCRENEELLHLFFSFV
jgi:hypothetical protein